MDLYFLDHLCLFWTLEIIQKCLLTLKIDQRSSLSINISCLFQVGPLPLVWTESIDEIISEAASSGLLVDHHCIYVRARS